MAAWYATGSRTANGDRMDASRMAAAHLTLPFGSVVHVENLTNGETVDVIINDRGPYTHGRVIDLTRAAAAEIGMIQQGVAPVRITLVGGEGDLPGCG